jgi:hypothetical protein
MGPIKYRTLAQESISRWRYNRAPLPLLRLRSWWQRTPRRIAPLRYALLPLSFSSYLIGGLDSGILKTKSSVAALPTWLLSSPCTLRLRQHMGSLPPPARATAWVGPVCFHSRLTVLYLVKTGSTYRVHLIRRDDYSSSYQQWCVQVSNLFIVVCINVYYVNRL